MSLIVKEHFESAHDTRTPNTEIGTTDTIDSVRSKYVVDPNEVKHRSHHVNGTRTPNTEFCMIDTIDSIHSPYVTDRKNHFDVS
jgi:hypothetical protein